MVPVHGKKTCESDRNQNVIKTIWAFKNDLFCSLRVDLKEILYWIL